MIKEPSSPAAVIKAALPANSGLDLESWPSWIRKAPAIQPAIEPPEDPEIATAPARLDPASVRVLSRVLSHS
ncbi:hypothetical protein [Bradyrhizobium sp. WSM3983]|uniref:hypothetical protein n=1 Tax=Bradyrhizobium sp. WSM3983 TaxID=1038867 RepID=UPI0012EB1FE7|nr:hypothetical protein [Bradyrhizobium sp. WSM3983]